MNYWLATTEFPPFHGGGISTYCWHTAKMLAENGHQVKVFINDYSVKSVSRASTLDNIETIRFNPKQDPKGTALGPEARLSLEFSYIIEQEMKRSGVPDILETQDYGAIGYYTLLKKHLLYPNFKELKILVTLHAPSFLYFEYNQVPFYSFPKYWTCEMEKASIRMADQIISPSNYLLQELKTRMNLSDKKTIRVFNPFKNKNTEVNNIEDVIKNDLVFFGKLTPQKGALEMLSYLKKMWDNGFDKTITIIGGEHYFYPFKEDMSIHIKKKYAHYIQKGLIKFEGNLPPDKLNKRLLRAHVVITPSIVDNLPYAVLEAMSMGKIILASSNSGHTEIITDNESGFIFNHEQKNSFQEKLQDILSKTNEELNEISKKAIETVHCLTNYSTVYEQKKSIIDQLLADNEKNNRFDFIEVINTKEQPLILQKEQPNLLSIVIPFYNLGDYIGDTIESLNKINYPHKEIIIIDDGSTEELSIKKLEEIKREHPLIKVLHKKNEGLSIARNFGAENSSGEFLAFLDADDTIEPEFYTRAIEVLKHYENVSFAGCWAQYFGESTDIWPTFNPEPPYLLTHNMINSSALIYKRSAFLQFGENDPKLIYGMEDYESVISMVKNGARGVSFPELWWNYRIRKNSMAQSFTKYKELYLYRLISEKHHDFYGQYGQQISNILNHNGPGIYFNNPTWGLISKRKQRLLSNKFVLTIKKNKVLRKFAKTIYHKIYKD